MHSAIGGDNENMVSVSGERERTRYKFGSVFILSVALHALALSALVLTLGLAATPSDDLLVVPVNIVRLSSSTAGPTEPVKADIPQHEAAPPSSPSTEAKELSPATKQRQPDDLTVKLRKLAQLRQPIVDTHLSEKGEGLSRVSAMSGRCARIGAADKGLSSRSNRAPLESRSRDCYMAGTFLSYPCGDNKCWCSHRSRSREQSRKSGIDPAYDEIALSARNAALLSSPLTLPPGYHAGVDGRDPQSQHQGCVAIAIRRAADYGRSLATRKPVRLE